MARAKPWEVSDELWAVIGPLLPRHPRRFRHPGRKRLDDRKALQGILFVLYTGIQWEYLPQELGFGSGSTCWRRLAEWQQAGVWDQLQQELLARLQAAQQMDFSRVVVDSSYIQAKRGRGSPKVGPSPVDRGRPGSKHHVLTDAAGTPLAVRLTRGGRHDVTQLLGLVADLPALAGTPSEVLGDTAYDSNACRDALTSQGITPRLGRRKRGHGSGLGTLRWVVEAAIAWLHGARKLRIRWETRDDMHQALLQLAHCMILARKHPAF
ncbi:IS5 family transposase [Actinopolyspora halophila]|nr:IS5 family transposase [Actinopolyspora halophila]